MTTKHSAIQILCLVTAIGILITGFARAGGRPIFKWTPDRNVTISVVSNVLIETNKITFTAKAAEPKNTKAKFGENKVVLIINRPPLNYNDSHLKALLKSTRRGKFAKSLDQKQFKRHRENLWKSTIASAKILQKSTRTATIAYSNPKETKEGENISSLDGYGFLFVKGK